MTDRPKIPDSLRRALRDGLVVPFVGAGVSVPVRKKTGERLFPDWKGLLQKGAQRLDGEDKAAFGDLVRALLNLPGPDYLQAAQHLKAQLGASWAPFLKEVFEVRYDEIDPTGLDLARAIWTLGSSLVITTNYDDVLRWACPPSLTHDLNFWDIRAPAEQAVWVRHGTTKKPTIWHLHGRIGNTADIILTPGGYQKLYSSEAESRYRAALATLRHQLASKTFLFIGFSLDDESFGVELRGALDAFEGHAGSHYVLASRRKAADLVKKVPSGVEVVPYESHKALPDLVRRLGEIAAAESEPREAGKRPTRPGTSTPTPPTDEGLGAWFDHVTDEHSRLADCVSRPGRLHLIEEAWVELQLQPDELGPTTRRGRGKEGPALGERLTLEEAVALTPEDGSWVTGCWLLEGSPGSGKTTLLRRFARGLAEDRDRTRIPVFLPLARIVEGGADWLSVATDGFQMVGAGLTDTLRAAGKDGRLVILLDGLDEVPPDRRKAVDVLLGVLRRDFDRNPVVVTSRPLGRGKVPSGFRRLELLPLPEDRQREFLVNWFEHADLDDPAGQADEALAAFDGSGLQDLAAVPLYLTLLAILWQNDERPPDRLALLFDQVFDLLLKGGHRDGGVPIPAKEDVEEALRFLAHGMTVDDRWADSASRLEKRLRSPEAAEILQCLRGEPRWNRSLSHFFDDVYERTHILGPHDGRGKDWRFWHRTFREALTAEQLRRVHGDDVEALAQWAADLADDATQAAGEGRGEGRWAEPLALLAGRLPKPDALVKRLAEVRPDLALRSMVFTQHLAAETLVHTLGLADDLEKRAEVFQQIPVQLGDPEACLALVKQLKNAMDLEKSYGFDFFWLDWILVQVSETWPGYSRAAEKARRRLFDRIPPPDPEMFRHVQTRDGRVDLWCEIPAGEGWIGSPDEEEERQRWEGPRHRITVERPFWMGAVPVTQRQYAAFDPHKAGSTKPDHPVVNVDWYESVAFCRWLSLAFPGARLPTEEEWEYACRAGTTTRFWKGDGEEALAEVGWYDKNSGRRTHAVGEKAANPWGLYDVHGNVWEWTVSPSKSDYSEQKDGLAVDSDALPEDLAAPRARRVFRGGCCAVSADWARSAYRRVRHPWSRFWFLGFRVLVSRPPAPGPR